MDIVAPPPAPKAPAKKQSLLDQLGRFRPMLPKLTMGTRSFYIWGTVALVALVAIAIHWHFTSSTHHAKNTNSFPSSITHQITGFKFYYPKSSLKTDFTLQQNTISLKSGVLVFQLKNPEGNALAFTEEATPPGYDTSSLSTDQQFNTEYGQP